MKNMIWVILLTLGIIIVDICLLSPGIVGLSGVFALLTILCSLFVMIFGNYMLLSHGKTDSPSKLKNLRQCQKNIEDFKYTCNGFTDLVDRAVSQIDSYERRSNSLHAVLGSDAKDETSPFMVVDGEVENALIFNFKKIANRLTIVDTVEINTLGWNPSEFNSWMLSNRKHGLASTIRNFFFNEWVDLNYGNNGKEAMTRRMEMYMKIDAHRSYIEKILKQNEDILNKYENLMVEVSQMGDNTQNPDEERMMLEEMTKSLQEMRESGV